MVNWSGLAARKYNIMQQQADTAAAAQQNMGMVQSQQARLLGVQAGLLPATAGAQARYTNIQADKMDAGRPHWARQEQGQANQIFGLGQSAMAHGGADMQLFDTPAPSDALNPWNAAMFGAGNIGGASVSGGGGMRRGGSAAIEGAVSDPSRASFIRLQDNLPGGFLPRPPGAQILPSIETPGFSRIREDMERRAQPTGTNYKKGIAKVPGKGNGTKDTVPAKLAPGEAVLNKAAAEHMGRGLIEVLNKMGAEKMGMP